MNLQVYLTVVIVVGLVLWFVIPAWFLFTVGGGGASSGGLPSHPAGHTFLMVSLLVHRRFWAVEPPELPGGDNAGPGRGLH